MILPHGFRQTHCPVCGMQFRQPCGGWAGTSWTFDGFGGGEAVCGMCARWVEWCAAWLAVTRQGR